MGTSDMSRMTIPTADAPYLTMVAPIGANGDARA